MPRTLRTFVAVEIPDDVRRRATRLIERLSQTAARVKWVEPHNLHLTLKFLGDVEAVEIPRVHDAVQGAVETLAPFAIELVGAGAFPAPSRPRTIWLGVGEGSEAMVGLHRAVEKSLVRLSIREEGRRFQPHLTIGRVRQSQEGLPKLAELLAEHERFAAGVAEVAEVLIFASQLDEEGPQYEVLARATLGRR